MLVGILIVADLTLPLKPMRPTFLRLGQHVLEIGHLFCGEICIDKLYNNFAGGFDRHEFAGGGKEVRFRVVVPFQCSYLSKTEDRKIQSCIRRI
jgi:hypothetical protein